MLSQVKKIIAVASGKGGVGKTTSAVNIAAYLAITETPTLLIDMDPQANASTGLGLNPGSTSSSIYDVIINNSNWKYHFLKVYMRYTYFFFIITVY